MEKLDAFWESRNLDKAVLELTFDKNDRNIKIIEDLKEENHDYIVAKVPIRNIELIHQLEEEGFRFMETQFSLVKKIKEDNIIPSQLKSLSSKLNWEPVVTHTHLDEVLKKIDENLFETDRIALDPYFNIKIANKRYQNWILDQFHKDDYEVYEIIFRGKKVGFFFIKLESSIVSILLAGIYREFREYGLGFSIIYTPLKLSLLTEKKIAKTRVSSNNLEVLRLYQTFGYMINDVEYVFRKFIE
ncbi:hypothetical protein [Metabacillus fastidiosus]|uniref:hypothetical protein n=1 Tax=Metabacillus fastidiosus TaxID=1458 RepID=UPI002E2207C7|nr:hypothetical protein [Metabacillus fastidiosus]